MAGLGVEVRGCLSAHRQAVAVIDVINDADVVRVAGIELGGRHPLVAGEQGARLQYAVDLGIHVFKLRGMRVRIGKIPKSNALQTTALSRRSVVAARPHLAQTFVQREHAPATGSGRIDFDQRLQQVMQG